MRIAANSAVTFGNTQRAVYQEQNDPEIDQIEEIIKKALSKYKVLAKFSDLLE